VTRDDPGDRPANDRPANERPTGPGLVVGLTGPIGCGKSTVAGWLRDIGATVIDADAIARDVTGPREPTLGPIRARFGDAVFAADGTLDRAALAGVVFSDPAALTDLEAMVHPAVRRRLEAAVADARREDAPIVVIEAIKLVEGGYAFECDEVWLVTCEAATQRERLAGRGMSASDAERRLATQGADLVERLSATLREGSRAGRPVVRKLATSGPLDATREIVEDALADALEPRFFAR
jgi:dephospho-CoA kinase